MVAFAEFLVRLRREKPLAVVLGTIGRAGMAAFFGRLWREKSLGAVSGIIILLIILVAIFADALAPFEYLEIHLADRLTGSSAAYPLGTDHLGRDVLSRIIHGVFETAGSGFAIGWRYPNTRKYM